MASHLVHGGAFLCYNGRAQSFGFGWAKAGGNVGILDSWGIRDPLTHFYTNLALCTSAQFPHALAHFRQLQLLPSQAYSFLTVVFSIIGYIYQF